MSRGGRIVAGLALAKLIFHVATNRQYGFHRDELATLNDARHLDWGFVAYPPVTPFVGRIELVLFGTSLTGFRSAAALAQCLAILLTAAIARRLGGKTAAPVIAAVAVAIAPISLAASALFQYVAFDYLWFVLLAYCVIRLADSDEGRWWLAIGGVIGIGVMTKYTMGVFALGLALGVFMTPLRDHLRRPWLWLGVLLSIVFVLPNVAWQARHGWIALDFLRHIHERDVRIGRTASLLPDQLWIATNPVTVPLWIWGLGVALARREWRILGWMAMVPMVLMVALKGRGYYLGPIYPMLFALGAVELERVLEKWSSGRRLLAFAGGALLAVTGASVAAVVLPLAPPGSAWFRFALAKNDDLAEEIGWPELADEAARIYQGLPVSERARTGIFCNNYGEAGALDLYGPERGLPQAISGTNSYWLRGPGDPPPTTVIVLGDDREGVERACGFVELVGHVTNRWNVRNEETERHPDIFLCRELKQPLGVLWPRLRRFG
jgi:hypothetical protein